MTDFPTRKIQTGFIKTSTHFMAVFPSLCVGVFVCQFMTQLLPFYDEQRDRYVLC
jgi:ABC-type phosphate transport system permease subunit